MEQRPLRLGDIVDDYCPRERRITNHAIVAVVGQDIKQTRCTTCDSEHVYKQAKVPRRRKAAPTAFDQVLAEVTGGAARPAEPARTAAAVPEPDEPDAMDEAEADAEPARAAPAEPVETPPVAARAAARAERVEAARAERVEAARADSPEAHANDDEQGTWFTHRRLIRATLPRVEGEEPPPRPIPEFTMHQIQSRGGGGGGRGRGGHGWRGSHGHHGNGSPGNVDGNRQHGSRHGRPPVDGNTANPGHGHGHSQGQGQAQGQGQGPAQGQGQGRKSRRRRRHKRPRQQ